jgi:hypothetical protein
MAANWGTRARWGRKNRMLFTKVNEGGTGGKAGSSDRAAMKVRLDGLAPYPDARGLASLPLRPRDAAGLLIAGRMPSAFFAKLRRDKALPGATTSAFPLFALRFFAGFVLKIRDSPPSPAPFATIGVHSRFTGFPPGWPLASPPPPFPQSSPGKNLGLTTPA